MLEITGERETMPAGVLKKREFSTKGNSPYSIIVVFNSPSVNDLITDSVSFEVPYIAVMSMTGESVFKI